MTYNWTCTCGDHWHGSAPKATVAKLRIEWVRGHGDCGRTEQTNSGTAAKQGE